MELNGDKILELAHAASEAAYGGDDTGVIEAWTSGVTSVHDTIAKIANHLSEGMYDTEFIEEKVSLLLQRIGCTIYLGIIILRQ